MKKLHKGKMSDCKVCTPDQKPKRRDKFEPRVVRKVRGLEGNVRRQMAEEIGEDELSKDFKFGLLQKYGIMAARIDRKVKKPSWKSESEWKRQRQEFHTLTVGLVPQRQGTYNGNSTRFNRPALRKVGSNTPYRKFQKPQHKVDV